jgi:hypothetical protein
MQLNILFCGCGFLATNIVQQVIPHARSIILVDREKIEKDNYNNSIFPKNLIGKRKVSALSNLLQVLTSKQVTPYHKNIQDVSELNHVQERFNVDFTFVTFDNVEARKIAQKSANELNIPTLFVGVTEGFIYIDWAENLVLPETDDEISRIEEEYKRVRDVCTRLEFRPLGAIAGSIAYNTFVNYIKHKEKHMYHVSVRDKIKLSSLRR